MDKPILRLISGQPTKGSGGVGSSSEPKTFSLSLRFNEFALLNLRYLNQWAKDILAGKPVTIARGYFTVIFTIDVYPDFIANSQDARSIQDTLAANMERIIGALAPHLKVSEGFHIDRERNRIPVTIMICFSEELMRAIQQGNITILDLQKLLTLAERPQLPSGQNG